MRLVNGQALSKSIVMQRIFAANEEADSKTNGHRVVVRRVCAQRMSTTTTHSKMRLSAMVEH
jgi:hypothetical protein